MKRHGDESWEVDALPPQVLVVALAFWWFALLDAEGNVVQRHERFLDRADCEWSRTIYERIIEASGREDRSVGLCTRNELR